LFLDRSTALAGVPSRTKNVAAAAPMSREIGNIKAGDSDRDDILCAGVFQGVRPPWGDP
jgi:hypothetical protein